MSILKMAVSPCRFERSLSIDKAPRVSYNVHSRDALIRSEIVGSTVCIHNDVLNLDLRSAFYYNRCDLRAHWF